MLTLRIEEKEIWNPVKREFLNIKAQTLQLEHSLISLRKWEAITKKPYLSTKLSLDELKLYVECMTLNKNVDPNVYNVLTAKEYNKVIDYINDPMTATTVKVRNKKHTQDEIVTAELIYYWMTCFNIPFECEKWHFNQLMMLITVCGVKTEKPKKMSKSDLYARQRAINARNRAKYHTKG